MIILFRIDKSSFFHLSIKINEVINPICGLIRVPLTLKHSYVHFQDFCIPQGFFTKFFIFGV